MALNGLGLGVTFTGRDLLSGTLFRLQRAFMGVEASSAAAVAAVSGGFGAMAAGIGIMTAGMAGLEMSFNLASAAGKFTQDVQRAGLIAQSSEKDLLALREAALKASMDMPFGPQEAIKGLQDIAAMGFSAQESIAMLRPALELAAGGGISVEAAAGSMASAMKVFGLSADKAGEVADKLLNAANVSGLLPKDLQLAMGTVGRGASATKQSLDDMLIAIGLVKNTGVQASTAASSVSSSLVMMATHAKRFEALGISVEDASGKFRALEDIVIDVFHAMQGKGMTDAQSTASAHDLFGRFGMTAHQAIVTQLGSMLREGKATDLADAMRILRAQTAGATGTTEEFNEKLGATYGRVTALMGSNFEAFITMLGEAFEQVLLPAARIVLDVLRGVNDTLLAMPMPAKVVAASLFLTGSVITIVAGSALFLAGALALVVGALLMLGAPALAALATFMVLAIPLVAVAGALTAAFLAFGAGLAYIFTNDLGGATTHLKETIANWRTMFQSVLGFLTEGKISGALREEFEKLSTGQQNFVVEAVLFFEKLKAAWEGFKSRFDEIMAGMGPPLDRLWDSFVRIGVALGIVDSKYLEMSKSMTKDDFMERGKVAAEAVAKAFDAIANAITGVNNAIASVIESFNWLSDNGVFRWLRNSGMALLPGGSALRVGYESAVAGYEQAEYDGTANEGWHGSSGSWGGGSHGVSGSWGEAGGPQSMPAVAAVEAENANATWNVESLRSQLINAVAQKGPTTPGAINVILHMDGQELHRQLVKIQRENQTDAAGADTPWSE